MEQNYSPQNLDEYVSVLDILIEEYNKRFSDFEKHVLTLKLTFEPHLVDIDVAPKEYQMKLFDIGEDNIFKSQFDSKKDPNEIWKTAAIYPRLRQHARRILSCFGNTYCCEATFSYMTQIKTRLRSQINDVHLEDQLKLHTTHIASSYKEHRPDAQQETYVYNLCKYASREFNEFSNKWKFNHKTSSPHYPKSNGLAERAVQITKNILRKCKQSGDDFQIALLNYRNTLREDMGSPAQRLLSRRTKTILPISKELLRPCIQKDVTLKLRRSRNKQKFYYDKESRDEPTFKIGQEVYLRENRRNWKPATIVREDGPRSYTVQNNKGLYRRNQSHIKINQSQRDHESILEQEPSGSACSTMEQDQETQPKGSDRMELQSETDNPAGEEETREVRKFTRSGRQIVMCSSEYSEEIAQDFTMENSVTETRETGRYLAECGTCLLIGRDVTVAIASSGIAATLLDGGRTAHSALKLPLNMQVIETPTCNISKYSGMGKVLRSCQLIIWDECTMAHKKSLGALNRTLKDLRGNEQLFGGALILLAGDFRQILPVIPRSTPAYELNAYLKSSVLKRYVDKISLKTNMRVFNYNKMNLLNDLQNNCLILGMATILNGKYQGEHVLLPRIPMIPMDTPFEFKRLQFPVRLAFAMTINKAQGQSLQAMWTKFDKSMLLTWTAVFIDVANRGNDSANGGLREFFPTEWAGLGVGWRCPPQDQDVAFVTLVIFIPSGWRPTPKSQACRSRGISQEANISRSRGRTARQLQYLWASDPSIDPQAARLEAGWSGCGSAWRANRRATSASCPEKQLRRRSAQEMERGTSTVGSHRAASSVAGWAWSRAASSARRALWLFRRNNGLRLVLRMISGAGIFLQESLAEDPEVLCVQQRRAYKSRGAI
ncbi:hypothetical protein LAZ67_14001930 [Cordylochernes scorpioides]|uniref:ATP-dependent DNA helicase n=1 Tax=Cordylochernes scorpioides TaxID=51811 RepID=A0ABY6L903_9ARAC|nr:hypothetical protein LAZ67_14001930 [Cordylochernes scorpioides]